MICDVHAHYIPKAFSDFMGDRFSPRVGVPVPIVGQGTYLMEHDRAEVWAPRWLRIAPTVRALAPGAFRRLAIRFGGQVDTA